MLISLLKDVIKIVYIRILVSLILGSVCWLAIGVSIVI